MKALVSLFVFFAGLGIAQADLNGFVTVQCAYRSGKAVKRPIVTLSTVYKKNNYEPVVTLSVAYIINGKRTVENARVVNANYTENYEGYYVDAITDSGRYLEISIYVFDGGDNKGNYGSYITVDGEGQNHMNDLTCKFATAG